MSLHPKTSAVGNRKRKHNETGRSSVRSHWSSMQRRWNPLCIAITFLIAFSLLQFPARTASFNSTVNTGPEINDMVAEAAATTEKAASAATDAAKAASAANDAAKAGDTAKAASTAADTSRTDDLLTGAACPLRSFTATALVLMADGTQQPIVDVQVGDQVLSYDPGTETQSVQTVTAVWPHTDTIVTLTLADGSQVETTATHPWWNTTTRTYTRTDHLTPGDQLLTADDTTLTVTGITGPQGTQPVYNLSITGPHTYYAGNTQLLAHNATCPADLDALSQSGARPGPGNQGLTAAGHKLDQHGGQGNFPTATGSVANRNQIAQDQLDDILTAPGTRVEPVTSGNFKGRTRYITPDGRGATFDSNGQFQYFGVY